MASVVNALRNITSDNWWLVKMLVFSYMAFFVFINSDIIFENNMSNIILLSCILIIYLGSAAIMINRNINNKTPILPSFISLPEIIMRGIISLIIMLPMSAIFYFVISWVKANLEMEPFIMGVIYFLVTLIFAPFIFVPVVLYCVDDKIQDALRIDIVLNSSGNFIVQFMSYIIQYACSILLLAFLLYKLLTEMLGYTQGVEILIGITFAFTIFSFFSYCSDLYQDVIPEIKKKSKRKKN